MFLYPSTSARPTNTGMVNAEIAVWTDTRDEVRAVSLPKRAANILSSAAGGALAAISSTSVRSWDTFSARQMPSEARGSTSSRSTSVTQELIPCSAALKLAWLS